MKVDLKLDGKPPFYLMSINTFLLLLLVIANYTNLFLNIKNRRRWNAYYWLLYSNVLKKMLFFSSLNQNTCPVYDAEEMKKQEQQEAIKKLYP